MSYITPSQAEANAYWSTREHKKYAVNLEIGHGLQRRQRTMYVRARCAKNAVKTALMNCLERPARAIDCRLATAHDLGCVRTGATA